MLIETKALIHQRAEKLFVYVNDFLTYQDPADFERGEAFKFCFLVMRRPRAYLDAFRHGELRLDAEAVESVYWEVRGEIPGSHGLMHEEKLLIAQHNREVENYLSRQPRPASVVAISERRAIGLLRPSQ